MANNFYFSDNFPNVSVSKEDLKKIVELISQRFFNKVTHPRQLSTIFRTYKGMLISSYVDESDFFENLTENQNYEINYEISVSGEITTLKYERKSLFVNIQVKFDNDWLGKLVELIKTSLKKEEIEEPDSVTLNKTRELKYEYTKFDIKQIKSIFDKHLQNTKDLHVYLKIEVDKKTEEYVDIEKFNEHYANEFDSFEVSFIANTTYICLEGTKKYSKIFLTVNDDTFQYIKKEIDLLAEKSKIKKENKIFISHGHSKTWKTFKDHFETTYPDEFKFDYYEKRPKNSEYFYNTIIDKIGNCIGAIVFLTPENTFEDKTKHARDSVIHELGLCQMKHGKNNVIIVVMSNCEEPSNIHGMNQIRTYKINSKFSEIYASLRKIVE